MRSRGGSCVGKGAGTKKELKWGYSGRKMALRIVILEQLEGLTCVDKRGIRIELMLVLYI